MLVTQRELLILLFPKSHFLGCVHSSSRHSRCPRITVPFHFLGNEKVVHSQNNCLSNDLNSFTNTWQAFFSGKLMLKIYYFNTD